MLDSAANWGTSDGFSRLSSCDSSDANEALSQGEDFCVLQDTAEGHFTQRCVNQIDQVYLVSRLFGPVTPALELTTDFDYVDKGAAPCGKHLLDASFCGA